MKLLRTRQWELYVRSPRPPRKNRGGSGISNFGRLAKEIDLCIFCGTTDGSPIDWLWLCRSGADPRPSIRSKAADPRCGRFSAAIAFEGSFPFLLFPPEERSVKCKQSKSEAGAAGDHLV